MAWPLVALHVEEVWVQDLHECPAFEGTPITNEPSYFVGHLPRYWRWLETDRARAPATAAFEAQPDGEPAS